MDKKYSIANGILWAAAIIASALLVAPPILTFVLLPALAVGSLVITRPKSKDAERQNQPAMSVRSFRRFYQRRCRPTMRWSGP